MRSISSGAGAVLIAIFTLSLVSPAFASAAAPSVPLDLQAVAGKSYVDVSWKAPADTGGSGLTNYSLYKGTDQAHLSFVENITVNVTAYHDENVETGNTYFYHVTAWNDGNESFWSNTAVATVPAPEQTNDGTLIGVVAIAVAAVAIQLSIIAIWVILKKVEKKQL